MKIKALFVQALQELYTILRWCVFELNNFLNKTFKFCIKFEFKLLANAHKNFDF